MKGTINRKVKTSLSPILGAIGVKEVLSLVASHVGKKMTMEHADMHGTMENERPYGIEDGVNKAAILSIREPPFRVCYRWNKTFQIPMLFKGLLKSTVFQTFKGLPSYKETTAPSPLLLSLNE